MRPNQLKSSDVSARIFAQREVGQRNRRAHCCAQSGRNRPPTQAKRNQVLLYAEKKGATKIKKEPQLALSLK